MDKDSVYFDALESNLSKKMVVFENIYNVVQEQSKVFIEKEVDIDYFNELLDEKEKLIGQVDELDKSFESLYLHIKEVFNNANKEQKSSIVSMQNMIKEITSLGVKIKVLETQNRTKLEAYLSNQKNVIRSYKSNSDMTRKYAKNMTNQHQGQAYFYDKKK